MTRPKAETSLAIFFFMHYIEHSSALGNFLKEDKNLRTVCVIEHGMLQN